jgi:hypothetical protein
MEEWLRQISQKMRKIVFSNLLSGFWGGLANLWARPPTVPARNEATGPTGLRSSHVGRPWPHGQIEVPVHEAEAHRVAPSTPSLLHLSLGPGPAACQGRKPGVRALAEGPCRCSLALAPWTPQLFQSATRRSEGQVKSPISKWCRQNCRTGLMGFLCSWRAQALHCHRVKSRAFVMHSTWPVTVTEALLLVYIHTIPYLYYYSTVYPLKKGECNMSVMSHFYWLHLFLLSSI